jgi:hypothetical protein
MAAYGRILSDEEHVEAHIDHGDDTAHMVTVEIASLLSGRDSPLVIGDCEVCGAEEGACLRQLIDFGAVEVLPPDLEDVPQFDELLDPALPYDPSEEGECLRPPIVFGPVELKTTRKDGETRAREIARAPRGSGADRLAAIGEMLDDE